MEAIEKAKRIVKVMQHFISGGDVNRRVLNSEKKDWVPDPNPNWNWGICEWRPSRWRIANSMDIGKPARFMTTIEHDDDWHYGQLSDVIHSYRLNRGMFMDEQGEMWTDCQVEQEDSGDSEDE